MEKAADAADMSVLFFSAGAIFRPGVWKTMCEECYTHCIISTRAISTSAISINSALFMLFADFFSSIGYLRCFVATFSVILFLGCFLYLCYLNRFSIECRCGFRLL